MSHSAKAEELLTVLLVDKCTEGLGILCGQESAHAASEDVSHHQGPLKSHPLVGAVPLQRGGCITTAAA